MSHEQPAGQADLSDRGTLRRSEFSLAGSLPLLLTDCDVHARAKSGPRPSGRAGGPLPLTVAVKMETGLASSDASTKKFSPSPRLAVQFLGLRQGDVLSDRFVLESPVKTGGMGAVWRARDRRGGGAIA